MQARRSLRIIEHCGNSGRDGFQAMVEWVLSVHFHHSHVSDAIPQPIPQRMPRVLELFVCLNLTLTLRASTSCGWGRIAIHFE